MKKQSAALFSLMVSVILLSSPFCFPQSLWSFSLSLSSSATSIGVDGTNGIDSQSNTHVVHSYQFDIPAFSSVAEVEIDLSSFGVGATTGFNLANIELGDVSISGLTGGLGFNVSVSAVTVDNVNKTINVEFSPSANNGNGTLVIRDLQNPPCPVEELLTFSLINLGSVFSSEQTSLGFSGSMEDSDGDRLPDGFEIYYGAAGVRGEEDSNTGKDLGLDPDVANSFTAENDGDGFHLLREFLACTDPLNISSAPLSLDSDGDNIYDVDESFPGVVLDTDSDGIPDKMDTDSDGDGVSDSVEAGKSSLAPDPVDTDGDLIPDFQDTDSDDDAVPDAQDNCRTLANILQSNVDGDALGDACDNDNDNDGIIDSVDNCPLVFNPSQADDDNDGFGNPCQGDQDGDGVEDSEDNCPAVANEDQKDRDSDALGDVCDPDIDGDGLVNPLDNCPLIKNVNQVDSNGNGVGDACDTEGFVLGGSRAACTSQAQETFTYLVILMLFGCVWMRRRRFHV